MNSTLFGDFTPIVTTLICCSASFGCMYDCFSWPVGESPSTSMPSQPASVCSLLLVSLLYGGAFGVMASILPIITGSSITAIIAIVTAGIVAAFLGGHVGNRNYARQLSRPSQA